MEIGTIITLKGNRRYEIVGYRRDDFVFAPHANCDDGQVIIYCLEEVEELMESGEIMCAE